MSPSWKWYGIAAVSVLQLTALIVKISLPVAYGDLPPIRLDRLNDLCDYILVYTPAIHAAMSLALVAKARARGEKVPFIAHWSRVQGCILAAILSGLVIHSIINYW